MKKMSLFGLFLVVIAMVISSCGGGGGAATPATLSSIAITPAAPTVAIHGSQNFVATGTYSDGSTSVITSSVTWASSDTVVATINTSGIATAVANGTTTITAILGTITGTTTLTVKTLVSIAVTPSASTVAVASTKQFTATGTFDDGTTSDISFSCDWTSSSTAVATIATGGLATAVALGSTTITATSVGISNTATLTVAAGGGAPGAFSLTYPLNGYTAVLVTPTLTWDASLDAATYTVEVATSSTFGATDVVNQTGLTAATYDVPASTLNAGIIYYYRVTAVNSSGSTISTGAPVWFSSPIYLGIDSPNYVAVTPDGTRALVTNGTAAGNVKLVSLTSHAVTDTITTGSYTAGVAVTPDGTANANKAVVANAYGSSGHSVSVIDLASKTVTSTTPTYIGGTLYDIAVAPDGASMVLGDLNDGGTLDGLRAFDIATGAQIAFVSFMPYDGPFGITYTTDGLSILTTNGILGTSIKRLTVSGTSFATISGTSSTYGVAVTPNGANALITSGPGETVKVISLGSNTVTNAISYASSSYVHNIAITPDGTMAFVGGTSDVAVISLADYSILATYPTFGFNVAVTPNSKVGLITSTVNGQGVLKFVKLQE